MKRKYNTEEERKAARKAQKAKYYQSNKEKILEKRAEYYQDNKEKILEQKAEYYQANKEKIAKQKIIYEATPKGRAVQLVSSYRTEDKKRNRGECTLTSEWIAEHIFTKPCHYCGKTDWYELGCDRINNSLPHIPENVVPCCAECNIKKARYSYDEFMRMIGKIV